MAIFEDVERSNAPKVRRTKPAKGLHDANRSDEDPWEFLHDLDTISENKVRRFLCSGVVGLGSGPRA